MFLNFVICGELPNNFFAITQLKWYLSYLIIIINLSCLTDCKNEHCLIPDKSKRNEKEMFFLILVIFLGFGLFIASLVYQVYGNAI